MSADAPGRSALITGGAGFIGSHLAELLLGRGIEVFVLDDLSTGSERNVAHLRERRDFHLVVDSVLKSSVVNELVHRCDVVYHLAAAVGVRLIVEQPVHTLVTNIQGTENVLEHCNRFGKRVLVASTSEVYGDRREPEALSEESRRVYGPTTARRWAYAESKALDEFLAFAYLIPRFVSAALAGRQLEIHGDGTQTRCFCHVEDTIRALSSLMDASGVDGDLFNVGSTERVSIDELAQRVLAATGSSSEIVHIPYDEVYGQGIEDMLHRQPSIEKVKGAIGWSPTRPLDEILEDVIAHIRRAPVFDESVA